MEPTEKSIEKNPKGNDKPIIPSTVNRTVTITFPKQFPKKVFVRRKQKMAALPGIDVEESKLKIGSSYKGSSVARGLTFMEEKRFLPAILGIDSNSPSWEQNTMEFWANITKPVPPGDGLELEVGMYYESKEDYEHDQNLPLNSDGIAVGLKGIPLNVADYILWRYCLVYSKVANDFSKAYASPNIDFYLFNKDAEIKDKKIVLATRQKAFALFNQNIGDRDWVDYMLRVLIAPDKTSKVKLRDLVTISEDEKDIILDGYMQNTPDKFLTLGNDKNLEMKSFIELGISCGKLVRIPNTDTITLDGVTLGNSLDESVGFLNNPQNADTLRTLKAQVKTLPS